MKLAADPLDPARVRRSATALAALVLLLSAGLVLPLDGARAATGVPLGTAESFAILAGQTITNTGPTTVTGDIGLHPGSAVEGFGSLTQHGSEHVANEEALQAKTDLTTAYNDAAGRTPATRVPTELGGTTLEAGVYDSAAGTFGVTGTLTLDGAGNPDSVFVFQMESTLITASASSVALINGADLCNIFWQVGSSATLGTNSAFRGTIMANQSIALNTGASLLGRVLARGGAVTLDTNVITNAACPTPAAADDDDTPADDDDTPADDDDTPTSDTPTDDTPTEGEGDAASGGGGSADDETTGQVREVPSGAVAAGGGGVDAATSGPLSLFAAALMLITVGGMVAAITRRRVQA